MSQRTDNTNGDELKNPLFQWLVSPLVGMTFREWSHVLKTYGNNIPLRYWPRTAFTTTMSVMNSAIAAWENKKYGHDLDKVEVNPPLFIIGHYRSGTTHLWRLMTTDKRFIYPTISESLFPDTWLTFQKAATTLTKLFSPEERPQDSVKTSADSPMEEEWALCTGTLLSAQMSRHFPLHRDHFKYRLSMKNADPKEKEEWKEAFRLFARKLQLGKGQDATIIFKNPHDTAKIKLLLDVFPDARFIHIHRNPYRVYKSTVNMEKQALPLCCYQSMDMDELEQYIIWRYREMYDNFFEDKKLIPEGHFTEIAYKDLIQDRLGSIENIYQELRLDSFETMKPNLQEYISSVSDYQKNDYGDLPADQKRNIADAWRPCFKAFGYSTELGADVRRAG